MFTKVRVNGYTLNINDNGHRAYLRLLDGSYLHVEAAGQFYQYTYYRTLEDLAQKRNGSRPQRATSYVHALRNACHFAIGYNGSIVERKAQEMG